MISKMSFGVSQVRDFLQKNGCVLTVRGYNYATDTAVVPELDNTRIKRKKVCEIKTDADLQGFLPISGFADVRDWWQQIKKFCSGRMWLYRVQIDESEISRIERDAEKIEQTRQDNLFHAADREFYLEHPLDIRGIDTDPALVDLQPSKDAARRERLQREEIAAERKRDRMRERAGEQQGHIRKTIPAKKEPDVLMITGNRKLSDPEAIRKQIIAIIDDRRPDIAISGMAIGADQLFAEICIEKGISLIAYIPFLGQEKRWPARVQKRYRSLLSKCSEKIIVCDSASIQAFQERNAAMVEAATRAIAVWDGQPGGTANTVRLLNRDSMAYEVIENGSEA